MFLNFLEAVCNSQDAGFSEMFHYLKNLKQIESKNVTQCFSG